MVSVSRYESSLILFAPEKVSRIRYNLLLGQSRKALQEDKVDADYCLVFSCEDSTVLLAATSTRDKSKVRKKVRIYEGQ
jgi:hypothetical protein